MQPVQTKLSLDRFARIMGIVPLHFWGVNIPPMEKPNTCGQAWMQHAWQDGDRISRDDVAYAIAEAERDLEQFLGYRLLPSWEEDEWQATIQPYRREMTNLNSHDIRGRSQMVFGHWGYLLSGGIRSVTTLEGNSAVSYANDGIVLPAAWKNRATVVVTLLEEVPNDEIAIYYPGHAGDDLWRIRPITVTRAGLEYTITFARELAVVPSYFESMELDGTLRAAAGYTDDNFLTEVDVCRVYNDPQQQATMLWENGGCSCGGGTACSYGTQTGWLLLRGEPRTSGMVFNAGEWDAADREFTSQAMVACRHPDLIRLWYYAGWRDKNAAQPLLEMDDQWARIVSYFAASKLDRPVCACSKAQFEQWQQDLSFSGGSDETGSYTLSPSDLANPFGTRRGAVQAWRRARTLPIGHGVLNT